MSKAGTRPNTGTNKHTTGGRKIVRFRRYKVPLVRPVRVVANKIETDPKLMSKGVEYPVEYKGEKYYVKKYDNNIFGLGLAKWIMTTFSVAGEASYKKEKREEELIINKRNFVPCQGKEVKTKRHKSMIGEITWIVHVRKDGKITYERLN
jgi:hypothetical protein